MEEREAIVRGIESLDGAIKAHLDYVKVLIKTREDLISILGAGDEQTCMFCGCTESRACPGGCSWIAPNVCTNCEDKYNESRGQKGDVKPSTFVFEEIDRIPWKTLKPQKMGKNTIYRDGEKLKIVRDGYSEGLGITTKLNDMIFLQTNPDKVQAAIARLSSDKQRFMRFFLKEIDFKKLDDVTSESQVTQAVPENEAPVEEKPKREKRLEQAAETNKKRWNKPGKDQPKSMPEKTKELRRVVLGIGSEP